MFVMIMLWPPENKTRKSLIINKTFLSCFLSHCPASEAVGVLTSREAV
jgi:hypothetical protein